MNKQLNYTLMSIAMFCSAPTFAASVDLSTWTIDGAGSWMFNNTNAPNDSANQLFNSIPTVLFNGIDSQGKALSGTIEVQTTSDDDFIGFVLGYDDNDLFGTNVTTDYILVDWKQNTQAGWDRGMSISRVTGGPIAAHGTDTSGDAWKHVGNVNFIERAATLGNIGWVDKTEYLFDIIFNANNIQVFVDGVQQFNISGTFENGSFGFYNFSQENVRYAGIEEDIAPPTNPPMTLAEPGTFGLFFAGLSGFVLARRKRAV